MRNNIDLRKEIDDILKDYGYYVLLQRTSRKIHCSCFKEKYQEPDSHCPICYGSGWVNRIEKHKTYSQNQSLVVSKPGLNTMGPLGYIYTPANVYHFKHDVHPQIGDLIYEVGWNKDRPVNLHRCFKLSHSEAKRGDNGRIEFYFAASKAEAIDFKFKEWTIHSIGSKKNYEIVGGS